MPASRRYRIAGTGCPRSRRALRAHVPGGPGAGARGRNEPTQHDQRLVAGLDTALLAALCALLRQAVQELGQRDTKRETAAFDPAEMVRILHEGRKRARESWEARQLEGGKAAQELAQRDAKSEPALLAHAS
jgi:hypothetical protein